MDAGGFQGRPEATDMFAHDNRVCLISSASAELRPIAEIDAALRPAWQKLAEHASEPNVFHEPWLLEPALQHFRTNPDLHMFLFWAGVPDKTDLIGLLPVGPSRLFGRWPIPHVQNWVHHNCFLGTPLVRKGFENQFWTALFDQLDKVSWPGFFHINGLTIGGAVDDAMRAVCARQKRRCDLVHSEVRALLQSDLDPDSYYASTVRAKKRKELRRQERRLADQGDVQVIRHEDATDLEAWIEEFLALERRGWKGRQGSALDSWAETRQFFVETLQGAAATGQLQRLDLRLDGKPLAMLVNFHSGEGSFSFKTTFDEDYARFSPGVLLQRENLGILDNPAISWMDSCAAEDHPMIDSLWSGRRHVGRFSVELKGLSRTALFRGVRLGEEFMAQIKGRKTGDPAEKRQ
ncbi:Acetyltransferase (GNAT) domain-containing protein [Parasphingorhabdus marina DSM 22363]|uniref:Acetyltransferase (GNAT) domain-containing protein n=1 Tax=Parasphingorhabdus marina DSM 22363 TaxID=1123272 RepID=A0A1N6GXW8_9SPHN|nr:GNAT family N-acetyltransferase [Parasphingorhabdus marina]SIO12292.1 Acetyltransferase (GNAT) domain-containing protein [Parasphingorhabdus marina DSM 22363]